MDPLNVQRIVDQSRLAPVHWLLMVLLAIVMIADGYDIYFLGYIAPEIVKDFGVRPQDITAVFFFQQVGLALGLMLVTPVADRFGRKPVLIVCLGAFGFLTLLGGMVADLLQLIVVRAVSGLFLGPVMVVTLAFMSEFSPLAYRARFNSLLISAYVLGGLGIASLTASIFSDLSWRTGFWIGGCAPLVTALLILFLAPETVQFRARKSATDPSIPHLLRRIDPSLRLNGTETFSVGASESKPERFGEILGREKQRETILLWGMFFLFAGNSGLLTSWLSTFYNSTQQIDVAALTRLLALGAVPGIIGPLVLGFMSDRFGLIRVTATYMLCNILTIVALGFLPFGTLAFAGALMAWCFFQGPTLTGIILLAIDTYSVRTRTSGLGWAQGIGRIGGIILPTIGGVFVAYELDIWQIMLLSALPPIVTLALLAMLARERSRREGRSAPARLSHLAAVGPDGS